jgi:hypothetical protein
MWKSHENGNASRLLGFSTSTQPSGSLVPFLSYLCLESKGQMAETMTAVVHLALKAIVC